MDRRKNDVGMWSYATTEKFIEILLEEAKKEQSANTRKTRVFNAHQWKNAHKEFQRVTTREGYTLKQLKEKYNRIKAEYRLWQDLMRHTGKGWDEELQTVAFPNEVWDDLLQKNPDYGKFRDKPIDHRNMLEELLEGALANGAFANPSVNGGSDSEGDRQKYGPPKTVRRGDVMSTGGKRKSEGSDGSGMKRKQGEQTHEAYDRVAFANERKAQFYETLIANNVGASSSSIDKCIAALALVQPFVDKKRYWIVQPFVDMKFTYVYPGWEGSAHDGRVFNAAVSNPANNFPYPPVNKYYVVDAGYTNMPGYLAPYRGRRYHRDEFNGTNTVFRTPMELFNYKHSSLRNVIERCFGVLKGRFPILKHMPNYPEARQLGIVTACCVIHNFILITRGIDEFFEGFTDPFHWAGGNDNQGNAGNVVGVEPINMSPQNIQLMAQRREQMAFAMWDSYDE